MGSLLWIDDPREGSHEWDLSLVLGTSSKVKKSLDIIELVAEEIYTTINKHIPYGSLPWSEQQEYHCIARITVSIIMNLFDIFDALTRGVPIKDNSIGEIAVQVYFLCKEETHQGDKSEHLTPYDYLLNDERQKNYDRLPDDEKQRYKDIVRVTMHCLCAPKE